jgi:hypothetical protein
MGLILGVDPDLGGALAWVDGETGALVELIDMPVLELKGKRLLDVSQLAVILDARAAATASAVIEKSQMRPGQGAVQTRTTAFNYGALVGLIRAQFIRLDEVAPVTWKRAMKVTADKDEARQIASLRWPVECGRWALKKNHGRAEAALLAAYGLRLQREAA